MVPNSIESFLGPTLDLMLAGTTGDNGGDVGLILALLLPICVKSFIISLDRTYRSHSSQAD